MAVLKQPTTLTARATRWCTRQGKQMRKLLLEAESMNSLELKVHHKEVLYQVVKTRLAADEKTTSQEYFHLVALLY